MSAHTKGPWRLGRLTNISDYETVRETVGPHQVCVDNEFGPYVLAECNMNFPDDALANARRIVACVNACEGLETGFLESGSLIRGVGLYVEQNNELLDICRNVIERGIGASDIDAMKTAIAKAEGKQ